MKSCVSSCSKSSFNALQRAEFQIALLIQLTSANSCLNPYCFFLIKKSVGRKDIAFSVLYRHRLKLKKIFSCSGEVGRANFSNSLKF